ncbi:hypothetical protein KI387_012592, partial [Taxus chinensis]
MGYQRSRHTSTVSTVEITPSCHVITQTSSKKSRTAREKENANAVSMAGSQSRAKNAVTDQCTLEENGGSQCMSGKRKTLSKGKSVKCLGKDTTKRKRACLRTRDVNAAANSMAENPADGGMELKASKHLRVEEEKVLELNSRDEDLVHDGRPPEYSNAQSSSTEGPVEDQSDTPFTLKAQELYSKLHLKYKRLKERKFGEVEEYIEGQNRNLTAYVQAQEELLKHIGREKDWMKLNEEKIKITYNRLRLLEEEKIEWKNNSLVQHTKNLELINEVKRLQSLLSDRVEVSKKIQHSSVPCQCCKVDCSVIEGQLSLSQNPHSENQCGLESNLVLHSSTVQTEGFQYSCQACGHNNRIEVGKQERKLVGNETSLATDNNVQVGLVKTFSYNDNQLGKYAQKGEATEMVVARVSSFIKLLLQGMVGFKITIADEGKSPKLFFLHRSS